MASSDGGPSSPPVVLTKEYIRAAFKHLEEIDDVEHRNAFFKKYMTEDVEWEITGNGHELAGTRYSLADHSAASFSKLGTNVYLFFVGLPIAYKSWDDMADNTKGQKLAKPIKFVIRSIILEPDTRRASIETKGYATRTNGMYSRPSSNNKMCNGVDASLGQPYNNDYVWLTQWNEQGQIFSVRSYHDTNLAEKVLKEE